MDKEKIKDLKRRFDMIDEALNGLSNHDRFGLLFGMIGMILQQQYIYEEFNRFLENKDARKDGTE